MNPSRMSHVPYADIASPLERDEASLLTRIALAGPDGYKLKPGEILLAYVLHTRELIEPRCTTHHPWVYVARGSQ